MQANANDQGIEKMLKRLLDTKDLYQFKTRLQANVVY